MLRLALIGAGRTVVIGHAPALQALQDEYRVVAIADQSAESLEDAGILLGVPPAHRYADYRVMLDEDACDIVSIALPHVYHHEAALAALRADAHVITERPIALTIDDAYEVLRLAEQRGKLVSVLHYFLFYPPFREAIRIANSGEIGKPFFIRCEGVTGGHGPGTEAYHPAWHGDPNISGGGVWLDSGYHNTYLCEKLIGSPVESIAARIFNYTTDMPVDDTAVVQLHHANDAVSSVQVAWSVPSGGQRVLEIYGTGGTITLDHEGHELGVYRNDSQTWRHLDIPVGHAESFIEFYRTVSASLQENAEPPVTHQEALHALNVIISGYQASTTRTVEQVPGPGATGGEARQAA